MSTWIPFLKGPPSILRPDLLLKHNNHQVPRILPRQVRGEDPPGPVSCTYTTRQGASENHEAKGCPIYTGEISSTCDVPEKKLKHICHVPILAGCAHARLLNLLKTEALCVRQSSRRRFSHLSQGVVMVAVVAPHPFLKFKPSRCRRFHILYVYCSRKITRNLIL